MNRGTLVGFGPGPVNSGNYNGIATQIQYFRASGTWIAPYTGTAVFLAIGAGGSGAACGETSGVRAVATGGGAGATCILKFNVVAGAAYTVTIGAGGTAKASQNAPVNGEAGGATTITGPGVNMRANGGGGGVAQLNTSTAVAGGAGGTASGGTINLTGGAGGAVGAGSGNYGPSTGGGAANLYGAPMSGGLNNSTSLWSASGGGGVGSPGGTVQSTTSSGGGSAGVALGIWDSNTFNASANSAVVTTVQGIPFPLGGRDSNGSSVAYFGAGSQGIVNSNTPAATFFGGGGGCTVNSASYGTAGAGGIAGGGGGGGVIIQNTGTGQVTSGIGGAGYAAIGMLT